MQLFFFSRCKSYSRNKKKKIINTFKATPIINNKKTLSGQSKRLYMKCSLTCIDYWQPEVKGPGLCSRVFRVELGGMGQRGGWWAGRGSKVLQVTVQVKRQNIICCLKKGTRGTYCTEGEVQFVWNKVGLI